MKTMGKIYYEHLDSGRELIEIGISARGKFSFDYFDLKIK